MSWVRAGSVADFAEGRTTVLETDGRRVMLCKAGGEIYAIEDICSHDGGPLDQGTLDGFEVECPRHGARFDVRNGRVLRLPAVRPVQSFATRVVDGVVEVEAPE